MCFQLTYHLQIHVCASDDPGPSIEPESTEVVVSGRKRSFWIAEARKSSLLGPANAPVGGNVLGNVESVSIHESLNE